MDIPQPQEIREIQARLYEKLGKISWVYWGSLDNLNLHFHVTLAVEGLTEKNFEDVWRFVNQQEKPDIETIFDNLSLIKVVDGIHSVYKTYWF